MPKFRGSGGKVNEFEHLLTIQLGPYQHKVTEEQKEHEDAIEFYQTLKVKS